MVYPQASLGDGLNIAIVPFAIGCIGEWCMYQPDSAVASLQQKAHSLIGALFVIGRHRVERRRVNIGIIGWISDEYKRAVFLQQAAEERIMYEKSRPRSHLAPHPSESA